MDTTFGELKRKVLRLLADEAQEVGSGEGPLGGATYGADLLQDAVHAALDAITSKVWKLSVVDIEGAVSEAALPSDVINVDAVYDYELGLFIPRMQTQIGTPLVNTTGNAWLLYPANEITFVNTLGSDGATIYYGSSWGKPVQDDDVLEPPSTALVCLILFAASYCLVPDAVSSASIRQFNTKVDSGQPTDIPARVISDFLLGRFERELQRLPMMERGRTQ
jgi:hypothetical protein